MKKKVAAKDRGIHLKICSLGWLTQLCCSFVLCLIQQVLTGNRSGALLDLRAHELGGHEPGDGPEPHREEEDEDGEAHQGEELELLGRRRVSVLQVEENACEGMNLLSKESHPIYSNLSKFYPRQPPRWP